MHVKVIFPPIVPGFEEWIVFYQTPNEQKLIKGISAGTSVAPPSAMELDDRKFLDHINAKIMKEGGGTPNASNPKALNAMISEETFLKLIGAFEYFLQRSQVSPPPLPSRSLTVIDAGPDTTIL